MNLRIAAIVALAALATACAAHQDALPVGAAANAMAAQSVLAQAQVRPHPPNMRPACPEAPAGAARCFAWVRTDVLGQVPDSYHGPDLARATAPRAKSFKGYGPADFQAAYNLTGLVSKNGDTVGIVDAFGDPTAESDLAVYRKQFGLPPCTTKNKCLRIINEQGQPNPLPSWNPSDDWATEESLDLDMVSSTCPKCHIVFVEANTNYDNDLYAAEDAAVNAGAHAVSNSWGGGEWEPSDPHFTHPGKAIIVASAGDDYLAPQQPASWNTVVAVGGTQLVRAANRKRGWTETVWNDSYVKYYVATGSGCSNYVAKPSWQNDKGCLTRANNDVAASADCVYYALIYDTTSLNSKGQPLGWSGECGTSEASPLVAGIYGLAGNGQALSKKYAQSVYKAAGTPALNPIVKGDNWLGGPCAQPILYICTAGPGYNGPGGNGSPNGVGAL